MRYRTICFIVAVLANVAFVVEKLRVFAAPAMFSRAQRMLAAMDSWLQRATLRSVG